MSGDADIEAIGQFREEIDKIDSEMLRMLNRRATCAISIGEIKKKNNLPIHVPEREEQVLQRLISLNEGPVDAQSVRNVFGVIFAQMRALEAVEEDGP